MNTAKTWERFHSRGIITKTKDGYNRVASIVARYRRRRSIVVDGTRRATLTLEKGRLVHIGGSGTGIGTRESRSKLSFPRTTRQKGKETRHFGSRGVYVLARRIGTSGTYLSWNAPTLTVVYDLIVADLEVMNDGRSVRLLIPSIDVVRRWENR